MESPLIVENLVDGFSFYESPAALTGQLEEWYVDEEEWRAWDAIGHRIDLVVEDGLVFARPREHEPSHPDELREALTSWLSHRGKGRPLDGARIDGLIAAGIEIEGITADPVPSPQPARNLVRRALNRWR